MARAQRGLRIEDSFFRGVFCLADCDQEFRLLTGITAAQFKELDAKWQQIGAMLNKMTERVHDFCKSQTR